MSGEIGDRFPEGAALDQMPERFCRCFDRFRKATIEFGAIDPEYMGEQDFRIQTR
ncbi:hypothetical protein HRbin27_00471 [bacterium HR27]|nr:hypothetical protein HRbin27_00471 [bacterium HR27]